MLPFATSSSRAAKVSTSHPRRPRPRRSSSRLPTSLAVALGVVLLYFAIGSTRRLLILHHHTDTLDVVSSSLSTSAAIAAPTTIANVTHRDDDHRGLGTDNTIMNTAATITTTTTTTIHPTKLNYLLFITTIFSPGHVKFFDCCWPTLVEQSRFLRDAHVVIFSNNDTMVDPNILNRLRHLFSHNPSFTMKFDTTNNTPRSKQIGANLGLQRGFQLGWFSDFDWMIRINPDVLIRNSTYLAFQMLQQEDKDAILIKCREPADDPQRKPWWMIHTDFFAIRPNAQWLWQRQQRPSSHLNGTAKIATATTTATASTPPFSMMEYHPNPKHSRALNHEYTATKYFMPMIEAGRVAWLDEQQGLVPSNGQCRVRGGRHAAILHEHGAVRQCTLHAQGGGGNNNKDNDDDDAKGGNETMITTTMKGQRVCASLDGSPVQ